MHDKAVSSSCQLCSTVKRGVTLCLGQRLLTHARAQWPWSLLPILMYRQFRDLYCQWWGPIVPTSILQAHSLDSMAMQRVESFQVQKTSEGEGRPMVKLSAYPVLLWCAVFSSLLGAFQFGEAFQTQCCQAQDRNASFVLDYLYSVIQSGLRCCCIAITKALRACSDA